MPDGGGKKDLLEVHVETDEGFSWQGRTERKGLAELLANEEAMSPLLDYLKSTEVGGREGGKEKGLD